MSTDEKGEKRIYLDGAEGYINGETKLPICYQGGEAHQ